MQMRCSYAFFQFRTRNITPIHHAQGHRSRKSGRNWMCVVVVVVGEWRSISTTNGPKFDAATMAGRNQKCRIPDCPQLTGHSITCAYSENLTGRYYRNASEAAICATWAAVSMRTTESVLRTCVHIISAEK